MVVARALCALPAGDLQQRLRFVFRYGRARRVSTRAITCWSGREERSPRIQLISAALVSAQPHTRRKKHLPEARIKYAVRKHSGN